MQIVNRGQYLSIQRVIDTLATENLRLRSQADFSLYNYHFSVRLVVGRHWNTSQFSPAQSPGANVIKVFCP
jgi:hypothetical protein